MCGNAGVPCRDAMPRKPVRPPVGAEQPPPPARCAARSAHDPSFPGCVEYSPMARGHRGAENTNALTDHLHGHRGRRQNPTQAHVLAPRGPEGEIMTNESQATPIPCGGQSQSERACGIRRVTRSLSHAAPPLSDPWSRQRTPVGPPLCPADWRAMGGNDRGGYQLGAITCVLAAQCDRAQTPTGTTYQRRPRARTSPSSPSFRDTRRDRHRTQGLHHDLPRQDVETKCFCPQLR